MEKLADQIKKTFLDEEIAKASLQISGIFLAIVFGIEAYALPLATNLTQESEKGLATQRAITAEIGHNTSVLAYLVLHPNEAPPSNFSDEAYKAGLQSGYMGVYSDQGLRDLAEFYASVPSGIEHIEQLQSDPSNQTILAKVRKDTLDNATRLKKVTETARVGKQTSLDMAKNSTNTLEAAASLRNIFLFIFLLSFLNLFLSRMKTYTPYPKRKKL